MNALLTHYFHVATLKNKQGHRNKNILHNWHNSHLTLLEMIGDDYQMKNDLERDLGLYATVTISMGAMIGSGIFVLPALGLKKAGPAVILAYILAGLVVLPAALSKAEMATANHWLEQSLELARGSRWCLRVPSH
jgi:amino acid permease